MVLHFQSTAVAWLTHNDQTKLPRNFLKNKLGFHNSFCKAHMQVSILPYLLKLTP